jgi:hypothetical protein
MAAFWRAAAFEGSSRGGCFGANLISFSRTASGNG